MKKALLRAGFEVVRVKGSHHFMVDPDDHSRWATVAVHAGECLALRCIHSILKSTRLTAEELGDLL
jgi:predicted RNA binding protein YcfA (HicA-like mRNA interferase family)